MEYRKTREMLLKHAHDYPQAGIQDYMKYLFQSAFGCEHMVLDPSAAEEYIRNEYDTSIPHPGEMTEPLNGAWCRVHLDVLREGLTAGTLAKLFALSAEHSEDGKAELESGLAVLREMVGRGELPLEAAELENALEEWKEKGYPACHHSESFRTHYHPAYRVLKADYACYLPLFADIDRRLSDNRKVILALDGNCTGGKTTMAALLEKVYGCPVFHMDDFFLRPEQRTPERYAEPGGNVDRERFLEEVLLPLEKGEHIQYRRFSCHSMELQPAETVPASSMAVVEGSYSLHPLLREHYTIRVFLSVDPETQLHRIRRRNGEESVKAFKERWIPLEQVYFDTFHPERICDYVFATGKKGGTST